MTHIDTAYRELIRLGRERALLDSCAALLSWDEETYMPPGGSAHRAEQQALLARLAHERAVDPRIGELLEAVSQEGGAEPVGVEAANVRWLRREYERARRLPGSLVEELARVTTLAQGAWWSALAEKDVGRFLPWLGRMVTLKRAEASCLVEGLGESSPLYDALLDAWEPGLRSEALDGVLAALVPELGRLLGRIAGAPQPAEGPRPGSGSDPEGDMLLGRPVPLPVQRAFAEELAAALGFDLTSGRLDEAVHPSTLRIGPGDTRLTVRYRTDDFTAGVFTLLHEAGHGLYEQGLPLEHYGTPVGEALSLGMHESQARLLENLLGRSHAFARWALPRLAERAAPHLDGVGLDAYYRAVNRVAPGPNRIRADEVTYNLHIVVRFELERALVAGTLAPDDLPAAWNEMYRRQLGVTPADDAVGCLQDGHWAAGMFGYFPTYLLGNLIAAQLYASALEAVPDLEVRIAAGELAPLVTWLRDTVHRHGSRLPMQALVAQATGRPLSERPLVEYLWAKYGALYGL
ncbi:MAG TPA: carboxypeptidase M32 [Polyangia bacterium]|jgi:carboxypeptidase Taq|nr:carboxypeptidase M32 [Polyangia bacterium]